MQIASFTHLFDTKNTLQIGTDSRSGRHRVIVTALGSGHTYYNKTWTNAQLNEAQAAFNKLKVEYSL